MPSVFERLGLRFAVITFWRFENDGIIALGIERRVEINQVNAGVGKNLAVAEPVEIVAEKEFVHAG